jgi:hypothetical protein
VCLDLDLGCAARDPQTMLVGIRRLCSRVSVKKVDFASKHDNYGTLEQEIRDAFSLVNLNGQEDRG